jgi:hypothetical protein
MAGKDENNIMNAQTFSSEELHRRTLERRAIEAAIWGVPIRGCGWGHSLGETTPTLSLVEGRLPS